MYLGNVFLVFIVNFHLLVLYSAMLKLGIMGISYFCSWNLAYCS